MASQKILTNLPDPPPELKHLKRFIREAKKTEKFVIIPYYCLLYGIQEAMNLDDSKKTADTKQYLSKCLTVLELLKDFDKSDDEKVKQQGWGKKLLVNLSNDEAKQKITNMGNNVFKHADEIDRAGNANKSTAAAFNSAFVYYTILKQFGDRDPKIIEAAKYCMFKTTDILKAIKEGRKPKPGPPGDDPNDDLEAELAAMGGGDEPGGGGGMNDDNFSAPSQPSQPTYNKDPSPQPSQPSNPYNNNNNNNNNYNNNNYNNTNNNNNGYPNQQPYQQPYQQPPPQYQQPPPQPNNQSDYMVTGGPQYNYQKRVHLPRFEKKVEACVAAEKTLKEAMAALRFEDVDTAIKKAEEAIAILQPHNN